MNKIHSTTIFILLCVVSAGASAKSITMKESNYGERWSFTVTEGKLKCSGNEVTFITGCKVYAVNGTATSAGYAAIEPIWKYNMVLIEELAAAFDMTIEETIESSPMRVNIGPIISDGLELCG